MTSERFESEYKNLNRAQKEAVDSIEGPVMVIAGPGSGKTQVLSLRVAHILLKTDIRPGNILCLTFTDSAAANMRKRLSEMIGQDAYRVYISTFHSFGVDIIERFPQFFYGGARFIPADELIQTEVLEGILKSLPYDNPLKSEHPEQGFTYIRDIKQSIGQLKKAGISPDEFAQILKHNAQAFESVNPLLESVFEARLSSRQFDEIRKVLSKIEYLPHAGFPLPHFKSYVENLALSLSHSLTHGIETGKTETLSRWKSTMLTKDENGRRVLKDSMSLSKLEAFASLYAQYQTSMYEKGFYDYDDMLLEVIHALEENDTLRFELQEQYQYMLVDEFQDTNDAQIRLLELLLNAEVNEQRPNIMVVGDDDQSIYKFQGAELNNILNFKTKYREPKIITMTDNYRSTQIILDIARFVILRGEDRLERMQPEIRKDLRAANPYVEKGTIVTKTFPTHSHELDFVASEIKTLIEKGTQPKDIAVIARKHAQLGSLIPFLNSQHIPYIYERQSNVLCEPHIRHIITIVRFISSLMNKEREEADYLLPEILSYPFWGFERQEIWKLSVRADQKRMLWLDAMLGSESNKIRNVADFLIGVAEFSKHEIAENVLDMIIGSHLALLPNTEDDEEEIGEIPHVGSYTSPFKDFYFGKQKLAENKTEYLVFLSALRTFINAVREYKKGQLIGIDDLVTFVDIREKNELSIPDMSPFVNAFDAVNLLSAHKAKGLEFKTVFILHCQDDVWTGRGVGHKLTFPLNLPISPAGDTINDQLRLFYVALTRAKSNLYLTASEATLNGKDALKLQFLLPFEGKELESDISTLLKFESQNVYTEDGVRILSIETSPQSKNQLIHDEEAMLRSLVEEYQMSVTHFNNYLDVSRGGPMLFLEQNLIRFPQEKNNSSKFGTALHFIIERIYSHLRIEGKIADIELISVWLDHELAKQRLTHIDRKNLKDRGMKDLEIFLAEKSSSFKPSDKIEVNFKNQGVTIGTSRITGKIDKMVQVGGSGSKDEWSVHDFKTGKPQIKWEGSTPEEKMKLHHYKHQLLFYKLLVENSREFCEKCFVHTGVLEFLEPLYTHTVDLELDLEKEDIIRLKKLIETVYTKILRLEFPDVSHYSQDLSGILAFEQDLLEGKI